MKNPLPSLLSRWDALVARIRSGMLIASESIFAGGRIYIASQVRLRATDGGVIYLSRGVAIDRFADVSAKYGRLQIGPETYVGQGSVICAREDVRIGENCLIGEHVTIRDQDHRHAFGLITREAGFVSSPVEIGDNVWLGAKVTVLKGVHIGANTVVGANSVVVSDLPANCVAVGAPAKVVRTRTGGVEEFEGSALYR